MANNNRPPVSWVNSFFAKLVWWEGKNENTPPPSVLISLGIKKETLLEEINKLPVSDKGFINLTLGQKQKNDPQKLSTWFEVRAGQPSGNYASKPSASYSANNGGGYKPKQEPEATDDLPF